MSSTKVETRQLSIIGPPDFSFPPKYTLDAEDTIPKAAPNLPPNPPNFGFPIPRNPTPTPIALPEITTPLTPLSPSPALAKQPHLLTLPLEIRLQIYDHILLTHPIQHAHLSPITDPTHPWVGARKEEFHTTLLRPLGLSHPDPDFNTPYHQNKNKNQHRQNDAVTTMITAVKPMLVPRTQGKLPTSFLVSCKQVLEESHMLPWEKNEFAFVNWFWSGVYAARQFSRGLRAWQSSGMRWCTVEVLGRDLWVDGMRELGGGIGGQTSNGGGKRGGGEWGMEGTLWVLEGGLGVEIEG